MISIAILGHGVVGSGVAEVLLRNEKSITAKAGEAIRVTRILDLRSFPELPYADLFTTNFDDILYDPDIRIVVETMGGLHPAYDFVKASLLAGKSVEISACAVDTNFMPLNVSIIPTNIAMIMKAISGMIIRNRALCIMNMATIMFHTRFFLLMHRPSGSKKRA